MIDFLKMYPHVTKEQYMWEWTIPQIKLASYDNTHLVHLPEKKDKPVVINTAEDLLRSFGLDPNQHINNVEI